MNRESRMIIAGGLAGGISEILRPLQSFFTFRGIILGLLLSIGILIIEKISKKEIDGKQPISMFKILMTALFVGITAGAISFHSVVIKTDGGALYVPPNTYSLIEFIGLISLYPLFILPAYFSKSKVSASIFTGACASFFIEVYGFLSNSKVEKFDHLNSVDLLTPVALALLLALVKGLAFSTLWIVIVNDASAEGFPLFRRIMNTDLMRSTDNRPD